MKNIKNLLVATLLWVTAAMSVQAADYTTYLTAARGFTEVTSTDDIIDDADYYYILTSAENTNLIVGVGTYEDKPSWASTESKALRYKSAATDPILDLTNFFTIEKSGSYIGFRNVVYSADMFQTHDNAGYMYVNTFTDKTLDEWSYLIPSYQNGYWLFENGKYPISSGNWACGYLGPWNKTVAAGEPIALNRRNTTGDEAGHYRLFRIAKNNLMDMFTAAKRELLLIATSGNPVDATWLITNPSFETGDGTGWILQYKDDSNNEFNARDYGMTNKEGGYLMNVYQQWNDHSVSQVVNDVPSGEYELSAVLCTWEDRTATLTGQTTVSSATATINGVDDATGIAASVNVVVGYDQQLTIVANSTTDWWSDGHTGNDAYYTQLFYKVDNVRLTCNGIYLNGISKPLPNDKTTILEADQWYYYEADYSMEYRFIGNIEGMVYSTDGMKLLSQISTNTVERELTLPKGRVYFKTTRSDATLSIHSARNVEEKGTFTAVALNVDGLPNSVAGIELNEDGPGSEGTKKISQYLATKGYDFIGCSEDFNYHGSLISSLQDDYSWGEERATLSASGLSFEMIINGFRFDTDGLNLLWKKSTVSASNESWTQWNSLAKTDGNQYVKKGYRHYDMTIGTNGPVIDVYVLHMDAGSNDDAINSRHSQWQQLAGAINTADATRPKLIIGDTNSRWTREDIKTNFMDVLNSNLTASDVWVEFYRNGIYPTTDMADLTDQSTPTNYTNYEIVDKIIYINPIGANTLQLVPQSFRIEQDYIYDTVDHDGNTSALGDHKPVVVTFKMLKSGEMFNTPITLADAADNSTAINNANGIPADVTLSGRTLWKDGSWNTLCLPFSMTAAQVTEQLAPTELKELDVAAGSYDHRTGIENSTLYLNFKSASTITAGKPYIIRWNSADNLENPTFTGVTVNNTEPTIIGSYNNDVFFRGIYNPRSLTKDDKTTLYVTDDNELSWATEENFKINAFRAYFSVPTNATGGVRQCVLNFGDEVVSFDVSGIMDIESALQGITATPWYTIDGCRINGQPTKPGVYVKDGRKVVRK